MSPIVRSVSILMRARSGPCCARTIHGAATAVLAKARRESMSLLPDSICKRLQTTVSQVAGAVKGRRQSVKAKCRDRVPMVEQAAASTITHDAVLCWLYHFEKLCQHVDNASGPAFFSVRSFGGRAIL